MCACCEFSSVSVRRCKARRGEARPGESIRFHWMTKLFARAQQANSNRTLKKFAVGQQNSCTIRMGQSFVVLARDASNYFNYTTYIAQSLAELVIAFVSDDLPI